MKKRRKALRILRFLELAIIFTDESGFHGQITFIAYDNNFHMLSSAINGQKIAKCHEFGEKSLNFHPCKICGLQKHSARL